MVSYIQILVRGENRFEFVVIWKKEENLEARACCIKQVYYFRCNKSYTVNVVKLFRVFILDLTVVLGSWKCGMGNFGGLTVLCVSNIDVSYLKKIPIIYKTVADNYSSVMVAFFASVWRQVSIFIYTKLSSLA